MEPETGYNKWYLYSMVFTATLGAFVFGYMMGILNPLEFYLAIDVFGWPTNDVSFYIGLLGSMVPLGAIPGALFGGKLASALGRRCSFIIADVVTIIGIILSMIVILEVMIIGRFICGFCVGLNSVLVPLYINEVSPISIKGVLGSLNQTFICSGILVVYLMGYFLPYPFDKANIKDVGLWRLIYIFPLIAVCLRIVLMWICFRYDTPKYLIMNDRDQEAKKLLEILYENSPNIQKEYYEALQLEKDNNSQTQLGFSDMFTDKFLKRILIGGALGLLQQFSGINALITYSTTIFLGSQEQNGNPSVEEFDKARNLTVLLGLLNFLSPLCGGALIYRYGRKDMLIFGLAILIACWIAFIATLHGIIAQAAILTYIAGFGISLGPIPWIYIPEILPDVGISLATLVNWVSAVIVIQTFPLLQQYTTPIISFGIFLISCIIGIVFVMVCVKETKDKTNLEIIEMYEGQKHFKVPDDQATNDENNSKKSVKNQTINMMNYDQASYTIIHNNSIFETNLCEVDQRYNQYEIY